MSEFERFIQERTYLQNVSPRTVDWYKQTFKRLAAYPLTEVGLKQFVLEMRQAGLQPISCNSRIRCANAFLKWSNSPLRIPKLREDQKVLPTYTEEQFRKIIAFRPQNWREARLHVLVLTLADTGARVDEALLLKKSDVNFDEMLLKVMGKGGKERLVAFSFELRKTLWKYMAKYPTNCDLVFPTRDGGKLHRHYVLLAFKRFCRSLGFEPVSRSIHAIRHTFALNYLRSGGSVFHLQKALGHSSLEMSRKYANLVTSDMQAAQHKVSLLNRLRL
jgi:integrase